MEASATTVNIATEIPKIEVKLADSTPARHSHGPNFGRYVPDCPGCMVKYPEGPPVRINKQRSPVVVAEEKARESKKLELLNEQLKSQLAISLKPEPAKPQDEQMAELLKLMLGKESRGLAKEQADEARKQVSREQMLAIEMEAVRQVQARQAACGHVKENGRSAIGGQVHNDRLFHPVCFRCFKEFTPYQPSGENIQNGMQVV